MNKSFKRIFIKILLFRERLITFKFHVRKLYLENLRNFGRIVYTLAGILSFFILVFEYGFYYPTEWIPTVLFVVSLLVNFFLIYEILSLLFTQSPILEYIFEHRLQFSIIALILIEKLFQANIVNLFQTYHLTGNDTTLIFLSTNQLLIIFANLAHFYRISRLYNAKDINPSFVFIGSFAAIILFGSIFLHFPKSTTRTLPTIDIIFTSVSATCVTGLSTLNLSEDFTLTGQFIILLMIQIGGLGLMTLTSFFSFFLAGQSSVNDKLLIKDLLSEESIGKVKGLLKAIAFQTIFIEMTGAILLYIFFPQNTGLLESEKVFYSIFHSISAFCNAGFSLLSLGLADPNFAQTESFLSVIMILIMLGGIGFPVINQLRQLIQHGKEPTFRLSISTRLVLVTSLILWIGGALAYYTFEQNYTLQGMSFFDQIFQSVFYSVTTRTAGFNTLDLTKMGVPITFISFFFMWVGASPISTAGGIKTTTLAISFLNIVNQIRGKQNLEIFHRSIAPSTIARASASIVLSLFVIFLALLGLILFESAPFIDLCFEVVSAFGTVGLTRGITPNLHFESKIILCVVMFVGRVGVLTLLVALSKRAQNYSYKYPVEYVVVG